MAKISLALLAATLAGTQASVPAFSFAPGTGDTIAADRIPSLSNASHVEAAAPPAVEKLDLSSFLGRWYQTYGSVTVKYATELGANCVYVEYDSGPDGAVAVTNSVSLFGKRINVNGFAVPRAGHAGEFQVTLGPPGHGPVKPTPYKNTNFVIAALGPIVDGKYDYAVITDPTGLSLYVLTRDVSRFKTQYDADVLKAVDQMGFSHFWNKPLSTNQEDCRYDTKTSAAIVV